MIFEHGKHRTRHGNVMHPMDDLLNKPVDFIYSDPPWGQGNLSYWQTMNVKMTGAQRQDVDLDSFLNRIFQVVKQYSHKNTVLFLEYGVRWRDYIGQKAGAIGLSAQAVATPVYGSPERPLNLFVLSYQPLNLPQGYVESIDGTKGFNTLLAVIAPFETQGKTILDPCCGMGYTARLALTKGMTFYGNELNLARLKKTHAILQKTKRI